MRGGHLDICVLGAFQVSGGGDLANWHTGDADAIPAVGGAMDLAVGARQTWVMMEHPTKSGEPKIVPACRYPLTGLACVKRIYTDLAVIDVGRDGLRVLEIADGLVPGRTAGRHRGAAAALTPRPAQRRPCCDSASGAQVAGQAGQRLGARSPRAPGSCGGRSPA